jgi:hypothetical protein
LLATLAEANTDCIAALPSGTMVEVQSGSSAQSEKKMRHGETRATLKSWGQRHSVNLSPLKRGWNG